MRAAALGAMLALGCTSTSPPPSPAPSSSQPSSSTKDPVTPATLPPTVAAAELVFEGRVVSLGVAPNAWSGMLAIYQPVTWSVDRVLRGDVGLVGKELVVRHPLVMGSKTAQKGAPGLDPAMFAKNAQWVVFVSPQDGQPTCLSENDGVVKATPALEAALAAR